MFVLPQNHGSCAAHVVPCDRRRLVSGAHLKADRKMSNGSTIFQPWVRDFTWPTVGFERTKNSHPSEKAQ